jgi:hypothetical protein
MFCVRSLCLCLSLSLSLCVCVCIFLLLPNGRCVCCVAWYVLVGLLCVRSGESILAVSLEHDNFDLVDALLERGASVNKPSIGGQSPLFIASTHGHKQIVELLLQSGADVHFKHRWQLTPLIRAVTNGHAGVCAAATAAAAAAISNLFLTGCITCPCACRSQQRSCHGMLIRTTEQLLAGALCKKPLP